MAGLNYGRKFRRRGHNHTINDKGVFYIDKINKWIVRVFKNNAHITTIAQFNTEAEAKTFFENYQHIK